MKKIILWLLIALFLLTAVSCAPGGEETTEAETTTSVDAGECQHVMEEATCTSPPRCKLCKRPLGKSLGHEYSLATAACTRCGKEDPLAKKEEGITRISCVGDSITAGEWYVGMIGKLDATYEVQGYGVSGATGLADGIDQERVWGYVTHPEYMQALRSAPDIVVIMLGTNDTKPVNSDRIYADGGKQFKKDMTALVKKFQSLSSAPEIYIALSPAIFRERNAGSGINDVDLVNLIIPLLMEVAAENGCKTIDVHSQTQDSSLFQDGVHPNAEGRERIADIIAQAILADREEI